MCGASALATIHNAEGRAFEGCFSLTCGPVLGEDRTASRICVGEMKIRSTHGILVHPRSSGMEVSNLGMWLAHGPAYISETKGQITEVLSSFTQTPRSRPYSFQLASAVTLTYSASLQYENMISCTTTPASHNLAPASRDIVSSAEHPSSPNLLPYLVRVYILRILEETVTY
jgi:hypothetical protein